MDKYVPGIGISAGIWMLKWDQISQQLEMSDLKLKEGDKINVFINFESILRNLSWNKDLNKKVQFFKQDVVLELESAILNLIAHYKAFFKKEKCKAKLYFYYTDILAEEQQMKVYDKYYRQYYRNRYLTNPQFRPMGLLLSEIIIPEVKLILSYVQDCYFLCSRGYDSSVIPIAISNFSNRKNVIITGDVFDTLYLFNPNFITIYIKRRFQHFSVISDINSAVQSIVKNENPFDLTIFNSEMYYRLLLSIKGSKIRNIRSAKGFGYGKFIKLLKDGIDRNIVLKDFSSLDSIIQLFPDNYAGAIKKAFQCTSIDTQYKLLSETDIEELKTQIVDKIDIESLESLNNKRFLEYPINLQSLI